MDSIIIDSYHQKAGTSHEQVKYYEQLANKYSIQRLVVFAFLIFIVYLSITFDNIWLLASGFVAAVFWFAWLVRQQNKYDELKRYFIGLQTVQVNEIESITKHNNIYYNGAAYLNDKHFYSSDLDIFGEYSLFQLINRSATVVGNHKLADWLNSPANKPTILIRQDAVKEIAQKVAWKEDFQTRLLFCLKQPANQVSNMLVYLKTAVDIKDERWLALYSKTSPFLLLLLITLGVSYPACRYLAGVQLLANNRLVSSRSKLIKKADLIAGKIGQALNEYFIVFRCIEAEDWKTGYNKNLVAFINDDKGQAISVKISQLAALINKLNNRLNMVVGFVLNAIFIWDIRQIIAIEKWKRSNHQNLEVAFDTIAEFEALVSLASLSVNYPQWPFPQIASGNGYTYKAKNIAHPLITNGVRVANDFELDDAYKVDIITGSNMAGKSTFLRTVGINAVLGLCGAPVCADSLELSVIRVITYMRIKDSLNESTSTFKAELDRLQMLLAAVETEDKVYFLIDEMLRGTNSVDKYLGSKAVIKQLIHKKGVGQVATHDLQIARLEDEYPDYVRNFYFDIQVINGEMLFDYRIKHGECKTFNASILLRQIGIDV